MKSKPNSLFQVGFALEIYIVLAVVLVVATIKSNKTEDKQSEVKS